MVLPHSTVPGAYDNDRFVLSFLLALLQAPYRCESLGYVLMESIALRDGGLSYGTSSSAMRIIPT